MAAFALSLLLLPVASFSGCSTPRDLDPSGVYAGDRALYEADKAILEASDAFDVVLAWADRNAAYLAQDAKAAAFVADVRTNRKAWLRDALAARDAYALVRGSENLRTMEGALAVLTRALAAYRVHSTQTLTK